MKRIKQRFMWFDLKPTFMSEEDKKISLLLKEITTLISLKSQNPNLYPKRDLLFWLKISSYIFS